MAGVLPRALQKEHDGASLSFALQASSKQGTIVLRSKWNTGRRFDLARIIGDRIMFSPESLRPVTQAYTYRQKAQRAFAAEFLSPFSAISDMLAENIDDEERHNEVADFFGVSPQVIESQLMNNECITRRFLND